MAADARGGERRARPRVQRGSRLLFLLGLFDFLLRASVLGHVILPYTWIITALGGNPAPGSSRSVLPSPLSRRIGIHIAAFGACSSFTRITARRIARPPCVDFVTRFRSAPLPGLTARQLSNLTINYSSGSFPHWYSAPLGHTRKRLPHKGWDRRFRLSTHYSVHCLLRRR